jgi:hypothetical protein
MRTSPMSARFSARVRHGVPGPCRARFVAAERLLPADEREDRRVTAQGAVGALHGFSPAAASHDSELPIPARLAAITSAAQM